MASQAYQLSSIMTKGNEKDERLFSQMQLKPMTPEQLFDSLLTATAAHKAGGGDDGNKQRDAWLRQFLFAFANDEAEEAIELPGDDPPGADDDERRADAGGPLRQAGQLPGRRAASRPASRAGRPKPTWSIRSTWRPSAGIPTPRELNQAGEYLDSFPDSLQVLQDLFWALLNSNEFVLIH